MSEKDFKEGLSETILDERFSRRQFEKDLAKVLNRFSRENESGTPDFILAQYLHAVLDVFNAAVTERRKWYGNSLDNDLDEFAKSSLLPQRVSEEGGPFSETIEVIICDSISGGARYTDEMPNGLNLIRRLSDGTEFRCSYSQIGKVEKAAAQTTD